MRILVLTNPSHISFIFGAIDALGNNDHVFMIKAFGEYDWSEDYDIGISFMYTYKVPEKEVNSKLWINFHPGPLPEYKGRNLCYHAIRNGEKEFGASVHRMDAGFDTGAIVEVVKFPIWNCWDAGDLSIATMFYSRNLFLKWLPKIVRCNFILYRKNVGGTYYHKKPINEFLEFMPETIKNDIRAITYGEFYPKINIGGVIYKIVRDE